MVHQIETVVGVFPGQGSFVGGALERLQEPESAVDVVEVVDRAAGQLLGLRFAETVLVAEPPSAATLYAQSPEAVQLAAFATSVAVHQALRARGVDLTVLVGHSLGEIAALVCSGALPLAAGAEVLCHRIAVLREHDLSGGGMLALGCSRQFAEQIIDLLPTADAVVAVHNAARQVAVSGTADAMRRVAAVAKACGVSATPLLSPHPFHHPLLAGARHALAERIDAVRVKPTTVPVFSPILGRYYRAGDRLGALLAAHLVLPVDFLGTVRRLDRAGARTWVEVGAGSALTTLISNACPEAATFAPVTASAFTLDEVAAALRAPHLPWTPPTAADQPAPVVIPALRTTAPALVEPVIGVADPEAELPEPEAELPEPVGAAAAPSRAEITARVRALYAAALEYPEDVFEEHAELEAELGVDSVKQTELLARVGELFELGPRPATMRMADYRTFGSVVDFAHTSLVGSGAR